MGVERLRELVHLIVQSWQRLTRHRGPHSARVLLRHCRSSLKLRLNVVIRLLKLHLCILLLWHIGNLIRLVRVRVCFKLGLRLRSGLGLKLRLRLSLGLGLG